MKHVMYRKNHFYPKGYSILDGNSKFIKINMRFSDNKYDKDIWKKLYFDILKTIEKYYCVEELKRKTYRQVSRMKKKGELIE
ncbi:MAG: hypothetical protein Q7R52_02580 [archaeon]|nr:hypothetical protein [archaeon]